MDQATGLFRRSAPSPKFEINAVCELHRDRDSLSPKVSLHALLFIILNTLTVTYGKPSISDHQILMKQCHVMKYQITLHKKVCTIVQVS